MRLMCSIRARIAPSPPRVQSKLRGWTSDMVETVFIVVFERRQGELAYRKSVRGKTLRVLCNREE